MPDDEMLELEESEPDVEELLEELEEEDPLDLVEHHPPIGGGVGVTVVHETSSGGTPVSPSPGAFFGPQDIDTSGGTGVVEPPPPPPPLPGETIVTEGVDVTVVEETSNPATDTVHVTMGSPFTDEAVSALSFTVPQPAPPSEMDGLHTRWRLRCPGSVDVASNVGFPLFSPANVSSCGCSIFVASFDAAGEILDPIGAHGGRGLRLDPGQSVPRYDPMPGAAVVLAACSSGCNDANCQVVFQVQTPVG